MTQNPENHEDSHRHDDHHDITIVVNGRRRQVRRGDISYADLVQLAFPGDGTSNDIDFTVSYANPHGQDGTLVAGQSVCVKEGMVFNVTKTNRS